VTRTFRISSDFVTAIFATGIERTYFHRAYMRRVALVVVIQKHRLIQVAEYNVLMVNGGEELEVITRGDWWVGEDLNAMTVVLTIIFFS